MAYNNLGVVYARMNDEVHEQQALEKALSLDEHLAPARQNLVKVYLRQKAYPQAETLLIKGLSGDPNNGQYLMLMADVQYVQGHYDAAIATAQKVHALPNDHPAVAHYIAAKAYEHESRSKEALAEFQMFLKEEPTGPRADHVRADMAKMQRLGAVKAAVIARRRGLRLRVLEFHRALVGLEELAQLVNLVEQPHPLLVVERDRESSETVNARSAFFADSEFQGALLSALDLFFQLG